MKHSQITSEKVFCIRKFSSPISLLAMLFLLDNGAFSQQRQIEIPDKKPLDTVRSSGIDAGDYLYISCQGPQRLDGSVPSDFDAQAAQALENIKTIVVAAGFSIKHAGFRQGFSADGKKHG